MVSRYAVIGSPVMHSLSPNIHRMLSQYFNVPLTYEKMLGDETHFEAQVSQFFATGGAGLNVTIPFKERAFKMANKVSARAQLVGAANTLWFKRNEIYADNTDGIGFLHDIQQYRTFNADDDILLLGAGGAARGILGALSPIKVRSITIANRTLSHADALRSIAQNIQSIALDKLDTHVTLPSIVINTLSKLATQTVVLPAGLFHLRPFCYDVNYQIEGITPFVVHADTQGCQAMDGLGMLIEQAAEAFWVWHGHRADAALLAQIKRECV